MTNHSSLFFRLANIAVLLFLLSTITGAQTADSKTKSTGSISGRITIDGKGAAGVPVAAVEGQNVNRRDARARALSEREAAENVLRFYDLWIEADGHFVADNIAPGKYWIVARPAAENDSGSTKSVREDATLRAKVFQAAEALKKSVTLKPCEEIADFALPYVAPASP